MTLCATYAEALTLAERLNQSSMGCELLIGPLSADGVGLVRDLRKRSYPTHVVFYTESQTQSQDPRLPVQYGCLAILRRVGLVEPLERLITDLRGHSRRPPRMPQEAPRNPGSPRQPGATTPATASTARPPAGNATRISGQHRVEPAATTPGTQPTARPAGSPPPPGTPPADAARSVTGRRFRRSVVPPPQSPGAAPKERQAGSSFMSRALTCSACGQDYVATLTPGTHPRCPHCQATQPP